MKLLNRNILGIVLLSVLVLLFALSYHPLFVKGEDEQEKGILSQSVNIVFFILFVIMLDFKMIFKSKIINICIVWIFLFALLLLVLFAVGKQLDIWYNLRPLLIVIMAMMTGWQFIISGRTLKYICCLFGCIILFVSVSQILTNIGGFIIKEQYFVQTKNSLGGLIAGASVFFLVFALSNKQCSKGEKITFALMSLLLFACLITIRARTASLITLATSVFIIFRKISTYSRSLTKTIFIMTTVILLIYLLLPVSVKEYVTDSFLLNSEYDITSGRMSRNEQAIHFLENNLLWGNINKTSRIDWIHNYPLLQLYDFGVIGGFPVLCLYFYILFIILKYLFKSNIFDIRNIGFILPIVPFGISLAEPTYPFGPGTVNVFYFIAFGIALRCHYDGVKNHPTEK